MFEVAIRREQRVTQARELAVVSLDRGVCLLELGGERRNRALTIVQFRALLGDPLVALGPTRRRSCRSRAASRSTSARACSSSRWLLLVQLALAGVDLLVARDDLPAALRELAVAVRDRRVQALARDPIVALLLVLLRDARP